MRAPGRAARFASFQIRCDGERASGWLVRRGTGAGPPATAGAGGGVGAPCAIAQTGDGVDVGGVGTWEAWAWMRQFCFRGEASRGARLIRWERSDYSNLTIHVIVFSCRDD